MRERATAVIFRNGKVLLVKDRGKHTWSLPGGGIEAGESATTAAKREIREELALTAVVIRRFDTCDFTGTANHHRVCLVSVTGEPRICEELADFMWWDMASPIRAFDHVPQILRLMAKEEALCFAESSRSFASLVPSEWALLS